MSFWENILGDVFPNVCEFCGLAKAGARESFICGDCRAKPTALHWVTAPICEKCGLWFEGEITTEFRCANCADLTLDFKNARAATRFDGLVKEVTHRFKYGRSEWFEPFLSEILIERAGPEIVREPVDVVMPIPLHPRKRRGRGFNQAERLAGRLAAAIGLPMEAARLRRVRDTDSQAGLDRDDRQANVRGAFQFVGAQLQGERVLLIDDVLTTGLTASACARELLKNGAGEVRVWTVARGGLS